MFVVSAILAGHLWVLGETHNFACRGPGIPTFGVVEVDLLRGEHLHGIIVLG
jgi:hypothetical protein